MRDEQIKQAAQEYAAKYRDPNKRDEWGEFTMSKLGFQAGAQWAGRPENITDDQIMAVLNAIGYEERSWVDVVRADIARRYGDNSENKK